MKKFALSLCFGVMASAVQSAEMSNVNFVVVQKSNDSENTSSSIAVKDKANEKNISSEIHSGPANTVVVAKKRSKSVFGIDVLQDKNFSVIKNKNVALLTNVSGTNCDGDLTLNLFVDSKNCKLKTVLFPEHDGGFDAKVIDRLKAKNIKTYCTHTNEVRLPKAEWLKGVDALVIDLQGMGMRYYTFYASALYAMCACFQQDVDVVVLDRPNPLGDYLGGPGLSADYFSFLGPIPSMPLFFPFTIGEFLTYAKHYGQDNGIVCRCEERKLQSDIAFDKHVFKKGKLEVVKLPNSYHKKDTFLDLGIYNSASNINMSPRIQNVSSIFEYAILSMVNLVDSRSFDCMHSVQNLKDKDHHFKYFYFSGIDCKDLLKKIQKYSKATKGCELKIVTVPTETGDCQCIEVDIKDFKQTQPAYLGLVLLSIAQETVRNEDWEKFEKQYFNGKKSSREIKKLTDERQNLLRKYKWETHTPQMREFFFEHLGDKEFCNALLEGKSIDVEKIYSRWVRESNAFYSRVKKYFLYR